MNYEKHILTLKDLFETSFNESYKSVTMKRKNRALQHMVSFYRHWLYSALIEDTILSPANLLNEINNRCDKNDQICLEPYLTSTTKLSAIKYKTLHYTLQDHYIVKDLKTLVETCQPDVELTERDMPQNAFIGEILPKVSIYDPFYVEFLLTLALKLNLLKKVPSIYSNMAHVTKEIDVFFALPNRKILDAIITASIQIATRFFAEVLPMNIKNIDEKFVMALLREPSSTDSIFQQIYTSMGMNVDIMSFFEMENDDLFGDLYHAMMSNTFYLGVMIDKYFYTVFGYYLKLITPIYVIPYDITSEIEYALDSFDNTDDPSIAMFSPCSHYTITKLGLEYFGIQPSPTNTIQFPENISIDVIMGLISGKIDGEVFFEDRNISDLLDPTIKQAPLGSAYEMKIRLAHNKGFWKNFEVLETMTLHDLYIAVCFEFGFDAKMNYSFFPTLDENPFSEFTSPNNKRRSKKAAEHTIQDLDLSERQTSVLLLYDVINPYVSELVPSKIVRFEMELLKIKENEPTKHYPHIAKVSQAFKKMNMDIWF